MLNTHSRRRLLSPCQRGAHAQSDDSRRYHDDGQRQRGKNEVEAGFKEHVDQRAVVEVEEGPLEGIAGGVGQGVAIAHWGVHEAAQTAARHADDVDGCDQGPH